jgi:hypothetical protein
MALARAERRTQSIVFAQLSNHKLRTTLVR